MITDLSENCELQTLINLTTYAPLLDAWHRLKKTTDPKEAKELLVKIDHYVFEAEVERQPLFRDGARDAWHLSFTILKAKYGVGNMFPKQPS
jgi:hypothetical protein